MSRTTARVIAASISIVSLSSAVMLIQLLYACYAPMMIWLWLGVR